MTEIFQASVRILKSAYRNDHISAISQASRHLEALAMALDAVEDLLRTVGMIIWMRRWRR